MDVRTPIGYAVAVFVHAIVYVAVCQTVFCAIGITIGCCGITASLCQNIARKFGILNENYKLDENVAKMKLELCDAIRLHIKANQLSIIRKRCQFLDESTHFFD